MVGAAAAACLLVSWQGWQKAHAAEPSALHAWRGAPTSATLASSLAACWLASPRTLAGPPRSLAAAAADHKKKLTDVRVNPKIAASLGLKVPMQPPPAPAACAPATTPAAAAGAGPAAAAEMDLLGGLDEPAAPAPAAAAPAAAAPSFDPFGAPAPAAPQQQQQQQSGWDAFGAPAGAPPAAPAAAAPLDLLGGLSGPTPAPAAAQQARPAAPVDPFAALSAPAAPAPAAAAAPKPGVAAAVAGVPSALPEDMFSDLTGIGGRAQQPMGHGSMGGMGSGWGTPPAAAQPAGSFGDFASSGGFASPAPAGQPVLPADFGSFAATSAPQAQQGGAAASGPDPFADLLKS